MSENEAEVKKLLERALLAERRIVELEIALQKIADQTGKYGTMSADGARRLAFEALKEEVEG